MEVNTSFVMWIHYEVAVVEEMVTFLISLHFIESNIWLDCTEKPFFVWTRCIISSEGLVLLFILCCNAIDFPFDWLIFFWRITFNSVRLCDRRYIWVLVLGSRKLSYIVKFARLVFVVDWTNISAFGCQTAYFHHCCNHFSASECLLCLM